MKVAIQIAGLPRFTREIDHLLTSLKEFDQVDWFFYLWNDYKDPYVSPNWPVNDLSKIREKIKNNLPDGHNIAYLEEHEHPVYNVTRSLNLTPWTNPPYFWFQTYGIKVVNNVREEHEKIHGKYDLVIRTRGDIGILTSISCKQAKAFLNQNNNAILMPDDHRMGIAGRAANDAFAIGSSEIMSLYTSLYDKLFEYNDAGVPYHPETMMAHHLYASNIATPLLGIRWIFRQYKTPDGKPDWGRWY